MVSPAVTIITPCYNAGEYLSVCIESVLAQTFDDWELLIIDDQSGDESGDVIARYVRRDDRIKMLTSEQKLGASQARNLAIKQAEGQYVAFLDADDWWSEQKLEKQVELMRASGAKFSCTSYNVVAEDGSILRMQHVDEMRKDHLLTKRSVVGCLTVLYDREYFSDFLFSQDMKSAEDYEMWCRMLTMLEDNGGAAATISKPLAFYRVHSGGKSHRKLHRIALHYDLYRNRLKLSAAYSLWCTFGYIINGVRDRL